MIKNINNAHPHIGNASNMASLLIAIAIKTAPSKIGVLILDLYYIVPVSIFRMR